MNHSCFTLSKNIFLLFLPFRIKTITTQFDKNTYMGSKQGAKEVDPWSSR